ncbi:MAG: hypothetical protein AMXMBFR61_05790 [Fimbriimonadales bacterium]
MRNCFPITLLCVVCTAYADDCPWGRVVASSGPPDIALVGPSPDPSDPEVGVPRIVSGAELPAAAFQFTLPPAGTAYHLTKLRVYADLAYGNGFPAQVELRVFYDQAGAPSPQQVPGSLRAASPAIGLARTANNVDYWAQLRLQSMVGVALSFSPDLVLDPGTYWMTVAGADAPLALYAGSAGGNRRPQLARGRGMDSSGPWWTSPSRARSGRCLGTRRH